MRAVQFDRFGPPEVLRINDIPTPQPGPGEVLVEVHAASVDAGETAFRAGKMRRVTRTRFPAAWAATSPAGSRPSAATYAPGRLEPRYGDSCPTSPSGP